MPTARQAAPRAQVPESLRRNMLLVICGPSLAPSDIASDSFIFADIFLLSFAEEPIRRTLHRIRLQNKKNRARVPFGG